MGEKWNQGGNQKVPVNKWQWTHNNLKLMGHSQCSPEREVRGITVLSKEDRKISNKQPKLKPKRSRKTKTNKAQSK